MDNFNQVILLGRLTADPELKQTQSGTSVTSFTLAVNREFKKDGDPEADFFTIKAFGQSAEFACRFFKKGSAALVVGELQNRKWTDKQGQARTSTEIIASRIKFAESKSAGISGQAQPVSAPPMLKPDGRSNGQITMADAPSGFEEVKADDGDDLPF